MRVLGQKASSLLWFSPVCVGGSQPYCVNNSSFAKRAEPGYGNGQRKEWLLHTGRLCGVSVITRGNWLREIAPGYQRKPGYWWAAPGILALLAKGVSWAGRPAFLPLSKDGARPRTGHCGKVQTRVRPWGLRGLRQARLLFEAMATPRPSDLRLSHSNREGQYFPQEILCYFHSAWFSVLCRPYLDPCPSVCTPVPSKGHPALVPFFLLFPRNREHWTESTEAAAAPLQELHQVFPALPATFAALTSP